MNDNLDDALAAFNGKSNDPITPGNINPNEVLPSPEQTGVPQTSFLLNPPQKIKLPGVTDVESYTKYGVSLNPYTDYNKDRANAQSNTEQLFNMFKQMGTTIAGETVSGFGAIGAIISSTAEEMKGDNAELSNALMEWGQQIQDYGAKKAPIYEENPNKSFQFGDWAWWMQNGVSVSSSLGLLIPGLVGSAAVGKSLSAIGKTSRALNIANKGTKLTKVLGSALASGSKLGEGASYYARLGTSAFIMRNGENLKESLQVRNAAYDEVANMSEEEYSNMINTNKELVNDFIESTNLPLNKENMANFIAAKAGWRTYGMDAGNVVFDMMQLAPLFKGIKANSRITANKSSVLSANRVASGGKAFTKGESFLNSAMYYGTEYVGKQGVTEGIEEVVNYISAEEGKTYGKYLMDNKDRPGFTERLKEYAKDPQMWEQGFWGAMGGMVFSGGANTLNSLRNTISDKYDATYSKNRINEIATRSRDLGLLMSGINSIENGIMPNAIDSSNATIAPDDIERAKENLINTAVDKIALNAVKHGNVGLLEDQLNTPEYAAELAKVADNPEQVPVLLNKIKERVLEVENTYNKYYANVMIKDIPENIKGFVLNEAITSELEIKKHTSAIADLDTKINSKLNNSIYDLIRQQFNETYKDRQGVNFNDTLNKAALYNLKREIQSVLDRSTGDRLVTDRLNRVMNNINESIENVKNNPSQKALTDLGVEETIIMDMSDKISHELVSKGYTEDINTMILSPDTYIEQTKAKLDEARDEALKQVIDPFKEGIQKANTLDTLFTMEKTIRSARERDIAFGDLTREYDKLLKTISNKIDDKKKADKKQNATSQPESVVENEPATDTVNDTTTTVNGTVDEETGEITPFVTGSLEETTTINSDEVAAPSDLTNPNIIVVPSVATMDDKEDSSNDSETQLDAKGMVTVSDTDENVNEYNPNSTSLVLFISSIFNIDSKVDENGVIRLDETETTVWNAISNELKNGDTVTIKPDTDQSAIDIGNGNTRQRLPFEMKMGIFDKDNNLLFHLSEIRSTKGMPSFSHMGLVYTLNQNWVKRFINMINIGKLNEEISALIQYKIAKINRNAEQAVKALIVLEKSTLFQDILNTNRDTQFEINDKDYLIALDHMANVVTYGISIGTLKQLDGISINKKELISSLANWERIVTIDLDNTNKIRSEMLAHDNVGMNVTINKKTPGSFIINMDSDRYMYSKLNHTISEDENNMDVQLYTSYKDSPDTLIAINDFNNDGTRYNVKSGEGIPGIPYIGLRMATIDGSIMIKHVKTQISHIGMENLPKDVTEYNEQLINYIFDTISNAKSVKEVYKLLSNHVTMMINDSDKSSYKILTRSKYKNGRRVYLKVINDNGVIKLTRTNGKANLLEHREDTIKYMKDILIMRNVNLTKSVVKEGGIEVNRDRITTGKFKDLVTGKEYANHTQFLVDTGAIVSFYGSVRDSKGKLVSNSSAFSKHNPIGQDMRVSIAMDSRRVMTSAPRSENVNDHYNNLNDYANALLTTSDNAYSNLFILVNKLGITFNSTERVKGNELAHFDGKHIAVTVRFDKESVDNRVRLLAHESIHGITKGNITPEHLVRLSNINKLVNEKLLGRGFKDILNPTELSILKQIVKETNKSAEEVLTYGLTNSVFAKVLNSIEMNVTTEPKSLARELLDIIKEIINKVFGNTALDEVAGILEEILMNTPSDETASSKDVNLSTETEVKPTEPTKDEDDVLSIFDEAMVSDVDNTVPNAIDYIRSLNKEERQIVRDKINDNTLIFKCK